LVGDEQLTTGIVFCVEDLGRVRPDHVKRMSRELVERFPDRFTKDFESNKELVEALTNIKSKKVRNRVAGYKTLLAVSERAS